MSYVDLIVIYDTDDGRRFIACAPENSGLTDGDTVAIDGCDEYTVCGKPLTVQDDGEVVTFINTLRGGSPVRKIDGIMVCNRFDWGDDDE